MKSQLEQEVTDHKSDRAQAKADLGEATSLRSKEAAEYAAMKADSDTNIAGLEAAIPAIEKGMGAASFLQTPFGNRVAKLMQSFPDMDPVDRRSVESFLQDGTGAEGSGEILGIMKQMLETMVANLKDATATEDSAVAGFAELEASKKKEIEIATEAVETKTLRSGELAVTIVTTKDSLEDTIEEVADNEKMSAQLAKQCATKTKEFDGIKKEKTGEIQAISEAIGILNDDDALDVFKKSMPSDAAAFLQRSSPRTPASKAKRAQAVLAGLAAHKVANSQELHLILYSMNSKLRLAAKGKVQKFDEIKKMIDDMVALLGKEQKDDDTQKEFCRDEFDRTADEEAAAKEKVAAITAAIEESTDTLAQLTEEIATLEQEIKDIDKAVAQATEQRKEEHAAFLESTQLNEAASQLVEKASQRLQKFYNPTLYKAPPKTERSMEQKIIDAGTFVQVKTHDAEDTDVAPLEMPEAPGGTYQKSEKSAGVIGLMDMMVKEIATDMKDAEYEEKTSQADYAKLMEESEATRTANSKGVITKTASKAEVEAKLELSKEAKTAVDTDLSLIATTIADLHVQCDFLLQNFDLRKEARANEVESLKTAKAN